MRDLKNKRGGVWRAAVSVVASASLALALCPAAALGATYTAPTSARDGSYYSDSAGTTSTSMDVVQCAAHAAAEPIAYLLGLDNPTYRTSSFTYDVNDLDSVASLTRMGVFGSALNENADTYLWNMFYNAYATANSLTLSEKVCKTISGGSPSGADTSGASIYWAPETLCGISSNSTASSLVASIASAQNTDSTASTYVTGCSNVDDDTTNDYDPYLVAYDMNGLTTMIETMYALAEAADDAIEDSASTDSNGNPVATKTSRYVEAELDSDGNVTEDSSVTTVASDYEDIILATQYYVLSQIDDDGDGVVDSETVYLDSSGNEVTDSSSASETVYVSTEGKTYAYISSIDTSTNTFSCSTDAPSVMETGNNSPVTRLLEGVQNCATNLAGSTTSNSSTVSLSAAALMKADVVIYNSGVSTGGGGNDSSEDTTDNSIASVLSSAGFTDTSAYPEVFTSASDPVGVLNSNGVENALYVPEVLGYIYDDVIDQMALVGWYFKHLYHVTSSSLQTVIDGACEGMTVADDLTVPSKYESTVESAFNIGWAYYESFATDSSSSTYGNSLADSRPNLVSYEDYLTSLAQVDETTTQLGASSLAVSTTSTDSTDDSGNTTTTTTVNSQYPTYQYNASGDFSGDTTTLQETQQVTAKYYKYSLENSTLTKTRVYSLTDVGSYSIEVTGIDAYTGSAVLTQNIVNTYDTTDSDGNAATANDEPTWTWSGTSSATVTFASDSSTSYDATVVSWSTTDATCTEDGSAYYAAYYEDSDGVVWVDTVGVAGTSATGHSWITDTSASSGAPEWTWSDDYSGATLVFTCSACGEHKTVHVASTATKSDGSITYTVTYAVDSSTTLTDTKTVTATSSTTNTDGTVTTDELGTDGSVTTTTASSDGSTTGSATVDKNGTTLSLGAATDSSGNATADATAVTTWITSATVTAVLSSTDSTDATTIELTVASDGTIDISDLSAGTYTVTITASGYETVTGTLVKSADPSESTFTITSGSVATASSSGDTGSGDTATTAGKIALKAKTVKVKASYDKKKKTNKKAVSVAASKYVKLTGVSKATYKIAKKVSGVKVASNGKITLSKGKFKKGKTVTVKVKVTAKTAKSGYSLPKATTLTVKLKMS